MLGVTYLGGESSGSSYGQGPQGGHQMLLLNLGLPQLDFAGSL